MPQWPQGIGQSLGDQLVTAHPLLTSMTTYFVDSATGNDTNGTGLDPNSPFATIGKAITVGAASAIIIVCLSGHTETVTTTLTPTAGTIIVGAGASGSQPTVTLTMNASNTVLFTCSAAGVQLRNLWFATNSVSSNVARVKFTGINGLVSGCYFECAGNDAAAAVEFGTGGSGGSCQDSTFISTAASLTAKPTYGMLVSAALTDINMDNVAFSDGSFGFSSFALAATATITRMRAENISLLLGANASLGSSTGIFMPTVTTGAISIAYAGGA